MPTDHPYHSSQQTVHLRGEPEWAEDPPASPASLTPPWPTTIPMTKGGKDWLTPTKPFTSGITPLGYGYSMEEQLTPTVIRKKGIKVAVFNAVLFPLENWQYAEGQPDVCRPSIDRLTSRIRQYKAEHPSSFIVPYCTGAQNSNPIPTYSNVITPIN